MKFWLVDHHNRRLKNGYKLLNQIFRRLSVPAADWLNGFGVAPEVIVFVSFIFGLFGGIAFALSHSFLGSFLSLISWLFDFIDGDLARISGKVSSRGAFLDSVNGKLFFFFVFGGVTVGYWKQVGGEGPWIWGFVTISAVFLFSMIKSKADQLDLIANQATVSHANGKSQFVEKPLWRAVVALFFSGWDCLLLYAIVMGFFGRLDFVLKGAAIYSCFFLIFSLQHGFRRVGKLDLKSAG